MSGAVSMVAWGVLEYTPGPLWARYAPYNRVDIGYEADIRALEILGLVTREFTKRGWLLRPKTSRKFMLLGARKVTPALTTRDIIGEGTLKEVCLAAIAHDAVWSVIPE